jgi:hypothetical protein
MNASRSARVAASMLVPGTAGGQEGVDLPHGNEVGGHGTPGPVLGIQVSLEQATMS